ncbi:Zinc finger, CCHC-type [Gossypium australe]|uniref:Zinc finger, CCHC-type n=1 Tax=Gossypium australe TaxID=47621 RepID=A0A5B6XA42_9ROSI|nr:Zinc finger, CCHC-type [Gossypium australe]
MHVIGSTFGGVLRSEISDDVCRLRVNLDVQKPLRRGIFVSSENNIKSWIPFKFEKLPIFCFGCGRLDHGINDCLMINPAEKEKVREDPPYTIALKAESKVVGKESLKFKSFAKKLSLQRTYTGNSTEQNGKEEDDASIVAKGVLLGGKILASWEEGLKEQVDSREEVELGTTEGNNNKGESSPTELKKSTWKRIMPTNHLDHRKSANAGVKRKGLAEKTGQENMDEKRADEAKKLKNGNLSTRPVEGAENRQLTTCQLTGNNEKLELECSWVGESTGSEEVASFN